MTIKATLCLIFFCHFNQILVAQEVYKPCKNFWELSIQEQERKKGLYLQYNESDSTGERCVSLVNNTPDSIIISGFYRQPMANALFKIKGEWKEPYYYDGCATGYGTFYLPRYSYTLADMTSLAQYEGSYETEARFYLHTKDSLIISQNFPFALDSMLITSREELYSQRINEQLEKNQH